MNKSRNNAWGSAQNPNATNGSRARSTALQGSLEEKIRSLAFVKTELELYLDTHPNCRTALEYYQATLAELEKLTEQYENEVGPLTAQGVNSTDEWTWVGGPWPWQSGNMRGRE